MEEQDAEYEDPIIKGGFSDLKAAILTGRTDIVRTILAAAQSYRDEDELFDAEDDDPEAPKPTPELEEEILDLLQLLLNFKDHDAGTPLHYATKLGRADMVRTLLSAGANPTIRNDDGSTPYDYCATESVRHAYVGELMQAAAQSKIFRLKQLLSAGVDINSGDGADSDNKVLHWAVSFGKLDVVRLVLERGANVDVVNGDGASALHDAVIRGDEEILAELLRHGADINVTPFKGSLEGKKPFELAFDKPWLQKVFQRELNLESLTINGVVHDNGFSDSGEASLRSPVSPGETPLLRRAGEDEEIILLSEETNTDGLSNLSLTPHRTVGTQSSFVGAAISSSPVQPYFPTITKVDSDASYLWPPPQRLSQHKGAFYVPPLCLNVTLLSQERSKEGNVEVLQMKEFWEYLKPSFKVLGFDFKTEIQCPGAVYNYVKGAIYCSIDPTIFSRPLEYRVNITTDKVNIVGSDAKAVSYGIWTFLHCMRIYQGKGIPLFQIHDWPSYSLRGVFLDFYDAFLPKQKLLMEMMENFSQFKLSQLFLPVDYFVDYGGSSAAYSKRDLLDILQLCSRRLIEVVPVIKISSAVQRSAVADLLLWNVFHYFPCTRYVLFDVDLGSPSRDCVSTGSRNADATFDLWSLILELHRICTSHGRSIIINADIVLRFPQRLPRISHGLLCTVNGQSKNMLYTCERLRDLSLPFVVSPELWTINSNVATSHVRYTERIVKDTSGYEPLGYVLRYKVDHTKLPMLSVATATTGYSLGHTWKPLTAQVIHDLTIAGIINRHVLQDQTDLVGNCLLALGNMNSLKGVDPGTNPLDIFNTELFREVAQDLRRTKIAKSQLTFLQQAMTLSKRCNLAVRSANLQCPERHFITREVFVIGDAMMMWSKLLKSMVSASEDETVSLTTLSPVQRSDLSNKLMNLVAEYRAYYRDNFLVGCSQSPPTFFEMLLQTMHPTTAENGTVAGIQTV